LAATACELQDSLLKLTLIKGYIVVGVLDSVAEDIIGIGNAINEMIVRIIEMIAPSSPLIISWTLKNPYL
jgi:hypothetical protein